MTHPFSWLPSPYRWILLIILLIGTVMLAIWLSKQGKSLRGAVPNGILSFEFAWTSKRAEQILSAWSDLNDTPQRQLYLDFAFLLLYPPLFSLCCAMLSESQFNRMALVGVFISWAVLAAAPLDAIENFSLLHTLAKGPNDLFVQLAAWCAGLKFTLVYAGFGYISLQGLFALIGRLRTG